MAFASVEIPVINRSGLTSERSSGKGKAPIRLPPKPRKYDDEPLPVKPSGHAPRNAHIVNRVLDNEGVKYQLKIGDIDIHDVGVDEILDYVSAFDLEEFENRQFEEEREVLKVLEEEQEQERRKSEKLERMKERAKRKGVVIFEDDTATNEETEGDETTVGRHGRARPTYTHLFKVNKERQRRSRDSETGELMPLSNEEEGADEGSSQEELEGLPPAAPQALTHAKLSKRRRRKRDKLTGELLPLSPVAQPIASEKKRQRRRRHPLTNELMPVGWRYDPNNDSSSHDQRRAGFSSPSFRKLSISQEHQAKRQRLDTESDVSRSSSPLPTEAELAAQLSPNKQVIIGSDKRSPRTKAPVVVLESSGDESNIVPRATTSNGLKPRPQPARSRLSKSLLPTAISSSTAESSLEPETKTSILHPSASNAVASSAQAASHINSQHRPQQVKTSILNPSAARASSIDPQVRPSEEGEGESNELVDDEEDWFIEGILAHHWSDPRTHPMALGEKPVMLYQVKWQGYQEPTWEPIESFIDRSVLNDYRRQVGLAPEPDGEDMKEDQDITGISTKSAVQNEPVSASSRNAQDLEDTEDEESPEEDEYEVESIITHQLSDPRTHPPELGDKPVMLYKVKWKGFDEFTWEPAESFEDLHIVAEYRVRVGLSKAEDIILDVDMNEDI